MKFLVVALCLTACSSAQRPAPPAGRSDVATAALAALSPLTPPTTSARASRSRPAGIPRRPGATAGPGLVGDLLDRVAQCESGGNTRAVDDRGRYFGAFQQTMGSWTRFGNGGPILEQSYAEQKAAAARQLASEGLRPWPVCGRRAAGGGGGASW